MCGQGRAIFDREKGEGVSTREDLELWSYVDKVERKGREKEGRKNKKEKGNDKNKRKKER